MYCVSLSSFLQDGMVNPTIRKDMKGSQKLYCCPIEGCPRGPNRPFSQFSLVKQVSLSDQILSVLQSRNNRLNSSSGQY